MIFLVLYPLSLITHLARHQIAELVPLIKRNRNYHQCSIRTTLVGLLIHHINNLFIYCVRVLTQ